MRGRDADGDAWWWTGPVRRTSVPLLDPLVALLWVAVPVSALLPVGSEPRHVALVLGCLVLAVAAARWPRPLSGGMRLGPDGVSDYSAAGPLRGSRRTTLVPAGEVSTLEVDLATGGLVLSDDEGHAVHHAPRGALGDLVTTVLAARARGLSVAFLAPERTPPVDLSWLDRLEARLTEAVLEPAVHAAPGTDGGDGGDTVQHPESPSTLETWIFSAAMAAAGVVLVTSMLAPALQVDGHATWGARIGAAAGALVAAVAISALARGRSRNAVCTWTVTDTSVVADDTRRGRWDVPRDRIAAALPLNPDDVPHVLFVDQLLRPVAEIPCVAPSVDAVARLLRRGGVTWVEPERVRAPEAAQRAVPPWRREAPGGRLRVTRDGLLWVDDLVGHRSVVVPAGMVTALRVTTRDGVPWLSAVVPAEQVGAPSDGPDAPRVAELFVGPLAELATTRSQVAAEAAEAGLVLQDLEQEVFRAAVVAEDSVRDEPPARVPAPVQEPAAIRHSLRTNAGVAGLLASICLVITAVLAWRAAVVSSPSASPAFVLGVGLACAALVFVVGLPGDTLRVHVDRVALTSRSGRRTRWTVLRGEVAAVGWFRDEDRQSTRLAFFDDRGAPVRAAHVPGMPADVERALAERGWPIGPARSPLPPPPQA